MPINSNNFNSQIETLNDKNPLKFVQNNKRSFKENLNDLKINFLKSQLIKKKTTFFFKKNGIEAVDKKEK